jgi:F-type H+-transporting ATPase subunit a
MYNIVNMSQQTLSVASEVVTTFNIGQLHINITNSMFTCTILCLTLIFAGVILGLSIPRSTKTPPNKIHTVLEILGESLYNFANGILRVNKLTTLMFSLCGFFFAYIVLGSWFGLIPGVAHLFIDNINGEYVHLFRAPTSDLSGTAALSVIAFLLIQAQGIAKLRLGYFAKFFNFSNPMNFFVGLLELISEISRLLSFALRLFGNIFAGEVMLKIVGDLSKFSYERFSYLGVPFPTLIIALEFFVALIQAYVFVALFLVFSSLAKEEAH